MLSVLKMVSWKQQSNEQGEMKRKKKVINKHEGYPNSLVGHS